MSEILMRLSCKQAAILMSQRNDRALNDAEAESLKHHLYVCLNCQRFDQQLDFLKRLSKKYALGGVIISPESAASAESDSHDAP